MRINIEQYFGHRDILKGKMKEKMTKAKMDALQLWLHRTNEHKKRKCENNMDHGKLVDIVSQLLHIWSQSKNSEFGLPQI